MNQVTIDLYNALQKLTRQIEQMRVPQNLPEAGLQITQFAPLLESANRALSQARQVENPLSQQTIFTTCERLSLTKYEEAVESYLGWCTTCVKFTNDSCDPDTREAVCAVCDQPTVYGAEEALIQGFITI